MKNKIKKIIISICILFVVIGTLPVKAYDPTEPVVNPFEYGWETTPESILSISNINFTSNSIPNIKIAVADNNYGMKNGYVTSEIYYTIIDQTQKFYSNLTSYTKTGTVVNKLELVNEIIFTMKSSGEYLYAFSYFTNPEGQMPIFYLKKYDINLNVVSSLDITNNIIPTTEEDMNNFIFTIIEGILPKLIGYDSISVQDNKIIMLAGLEELLVISEDFTTTSKLPLDEENVKKYFPNIGAEIDIFKSYFEQAEQYIEIDEVYLNTDVNDKYRVSSGITYKREPELDLNHGLVIPQQIANIILDELSDEEVEEPENPDQITPHEEYLAYDGKIGLYNEDNELIWEKENRDYVLLFNTQMIGNYIVTIGANIDAPIGLYDGSSFFEIIDDELGVGDKRFHELLSEFISEFGINTDILVYDMKGNLVQKISDDSIHLGLFPSESGFIVNSVQGTSELINIYKTIVDEYYGDVESIVKQITDYFSGPNTGEAFQPQIPMRFGSYVLNLLENSPIKTNHKVYHVISRVNVVVEGKGTISAPTTSIMGEEVVFTVTPKEGHVLEAIRVTDMEGNELLVTSEHTFTMPSQDVIIEAQFKKVYNPKTSALTVTGAIVVMIIVTTLIIKNKNKLKWLN